MLGKERSEKSDTQAHHVGELQEDAWKEVLWIWGKTDLTSYCKSLLELWNPQLKAAIESVKHLVMFAIPTKSDAEKASDHPLRTMATHKSRSECALSPQTSFPMHIPRLKATHTQRQQEDRRRANHMLHCYCRCSLLISRFLDGSSCLMWTPQIHMLPLSLNDSLGMYCSFLLDLLIFTYSPVSPYSQGYLSWCYLPDCDFSSLFRAQEKIWSF